MEKLLHERLREPDTELCIGEMLELIVTGKTEDCTGKLCGQCIVDAMNALADEIERYYIPRPRFEDGEPVQFGDATKMQDNIEAMLFKADGSFETHQKFKNKCGTSVAIYEPNEFVKRPTPKVYDADRVAYEVGQYVYSVENGLKWRVVDIFDKDESDDSPEIKCHRDIEEGWKSGEPKDCILPPNKFTHERPVFDAEGVRICKGDTVWDTKDYKGTVKEIKPDVPQVIVERGINNYAYLTPDALTHREPDSLEKLRDDINASKILFADCDVPALTEWANRLTALIEMGA